MLESVNSAVEDETDNGIIGKVKWEAASSGTSQEFENASVGSVTFESQEFENASVGSVTFEEEVDVTSKIKTDSPTTSPAATPRETEVVSCRAATRVIASGSSGRVRIRCHSDRRRRRKQERNKDG